MRTTRNYTVKDVDMLVAASAIIESAINNKDVLQAKRATWADPFFGNLQARIDKAIQNHLGLDNAKELRQATATLLQVQSAALRDLAEAKIQIVEDFKADPERRHELLFQLGYISYHKAAQNGDQEALINLLYQFSGNLTTDIISELAQKGIAPGLLESIAARAFPVKESNVIQENRKSQRLEITDATLGEFNAIYDEIVSIARISQKFFKGNEALRLQFSFQKVVKTLNFHPRQDQ